MKEMEYKFLVGGDTFERVRAVAEEHIGPALHIVQINYYFDDERHRLNERGVTLRVRQTDGQLLLQRKRHSGSDRSLAISREDERIVTQLPGIIDSQYTLQGQLITHRQRFCIAEQLRLDMDTSFYLGVCDHEIELEFQTGQRLLAQAWIERLGLPSHDAGQSKSTRFFSRLEAYRGLVFEKAGDLEWM